MQRQRDGQRSNASLSSFLALGFIEWLKQKWIDVKIANTMREIDRQSEEIKKIWEEKDKPKTIITETPSEVKGLNDMEIKYDGGS